MCVVLCFVLILLYSFDSFLFCNHLAEKGKYNLFAYCDIVFMFVSLFIFILGFMSLGAITGSVICKYDKCRTYAFEPRREKNCLRGLRQSEIQSSLLSYRD